MFEQLPEELRLTPKWCIGGPDKSPWTTSGRHADVNDPATWTDSYSATLVAGQWGAPVGFILGEDDLYTCIDLDIKNEITHPDKPSVWTKPDQIERYHRIIQAFNSYTEHSYSGFGYHIWVKGKIGSGCRRDGVEVYSQQRFIICTGNVVVNAPIEERQELLQVLVDEIRQAAQTSVTTLVELDPAESDNAIWEKAVTANNAQKFLELWSGNWQGMGYPSQSEADLALLSMLCFYTKSNEQVRRIFRYSGLGQREKAVKNNRYIDRTLIMIRARQEREDLQTEAARDIAAKFSSNLMLPAAPIAQEGSQPLNPNVQQAEIRPEVNLDWPPGLAGEIAQWIYSISPRPVKEISIVAALGFLSGLCGRAFNINGSGLNTYIVLVARSAIGKEALNSGISRLMNIMSSTCPNISNFVDFASYVSGPALTKAVISRGSLVNISGEWGRKLRRMAADKTDGPMDSLRTDMTNLYQKSGRGSSVGGIGYSDKDKNMLSNHAVAYSMIGETTPTTFYESLTSSMMEDGFLSRFITIEYKGDRPPLNPINDVMVSENIGNTVTNLYAKIESTPPDFANEVAMSREAQEMLDTFDKFCDLQINSTDEEMQRQMWNRAHLKALKISALLAVGDNAHAPCIQQYHAEWALSLIYRDIQILQSKMDQGDVGNTDDTRDKKALSIIKEFFSKPLPKGYRIPKEIQANGIIPHRYLQTRLSRNAAFYSHKLGVTAAVNLTLKSLADSGYLEEISKDALTRNGVPAGIGKCYQMLSDPSPLDKEMQ